MRLETEDMLIVSQGQEISVSVGGATAYCDRWAAVRTNELDRLFNSSFRYQEAVISWGEISHTLGGELRFGDRDQIDALKSYQALTIRDKLVKGEYVILSD